MSPERIAELHKRLRDARDEFLDTYIPPEITAAQIKELCEKNAQNMMAAFNALPPNEQRVALNEQFEDARRRKKEREEATRRRY